MIAQSAKKILCLALVLANCTLLCVKTNALVTTNSPDIKIVSPQDLGFATFREQTSSLSLQIPVAFGKDGEQTSDADAYTSKTQAWILKTDGTIVPQLSQPSMITIGDMGNYETHYLFYDFAKVPANELAGVVISRNGKFYCRQIEMSGRPPIAPPDGLLQVSPTNISQTPLFVQVTNFDNYEHFTVFYKTDNPTAKFLSAWQELSDGDAVINSNPATATATTNGVLFKFGGGYLWPPFKFKVIEKQYPGETRRPGYSGYWFYPRDFLANAPKETNAVKVVNGKDYRRMDITMAGLNEPINLTSQTRQYTVQMMIGSYPDDEIWRMPKVNELHRQAWLLRADGTAISQASPPVRVGGGGGGWTDMFLDFRFPRKPGDDAVGLVVSIGGGLYYHELK